MLNGFDGPATPPVPPPARPLASSLSCRHCGYNLLGLSPDARCPECGRPVAETLADVSYADPRWLAGVRVGIPLLLAGLLCLSALLALVALDLRLGRTWRGGPASPGPVLRWVEEVVPVRLFLENWGLPGFFNPAGWYENEGRPAAFAAALWMLVPAACGALGLWLVTRPHAATFAAEPRASRRRATRLLAGAAGAGLALAAAFPLVREEPGVLWPVVLVAFLLNALQVPAAVLALLHLRDLAARLGLRLRRLRGAAVLSSLGLGFFALVAGGFVLQIYWVPLPARVGDFIDAWRVTGCLAGSVSLLVMALALVGLRRHLRLAARVTWAMFQEFVPPPAPGAPAALAASARRLRLGTAAVALVLTVAGFIAWQSYRGPRPLSAIRAGGPRQRFALCPDGRHVLASPIDAYEDPALYDVESGALVRRFDARPSAPLATRPLMLYAGLAVSADGSRAAFCGPNEIIVWECPGGREVCRLPEPRAGYCPMSVALSPDGRQVAWVVSAEGAVPPGPPLDFDVRLCAADAGAAPEVVKLGGPAQPLTIVFAPDSRRLLAVEFNRGGPAHLIDVAGRRETARVPLWPCQFVNSAAFVPSGGVLLAADKVYRGDPAPLASAAPLDPGRPGYVAYLAVSPDGRRALGSAHHRLWLWDLDTGRLVATFRRVSGTPQVSFSPDGRRALAADSEDGTVSVWKLPP